MTLDFLASYACDDNNTFSAKQLTCGEGAMSMGSACRFRPKALPVAGGTFGLSMLLLLIAGCGDSTQISPEESPAAPSAVSGESPRLRVSRAEFGDKWPLTVESGEIECIDTYFIVFHSEGKTYALNGLAKGHGYPEIDPIWKDDPKSPGWKININPLSERGLQLQSQILGKPIAIAEKQPSNPVETAKSDEFWNGLESQFTQAKQIIKAAQNPAIELQSIEAVQEGGDLVVRGEGKNVGECTLAVLTASVEVGSQLDGVRVDGNRGTDLTIPVGGEFSFELHFYDTTKQGPIRVWFGMDDASDSDLRNNPIVPVRTDGGVLQSAIELK